LLKTKTIDVNPLLKHKALKTSKKIEVPFSQDEIENVLDHLNFDDSFEGTRDYLIIELFYSTGIRRSELINIKITDIDYSRQTLKVLGKRNKERIIPLLQTIKSSLDEYLAYRNNLSVITDKDYLFLTKKGLKVYETLVYRIINEYFSKA